MKVPALLAPFYNSVNNHLMSKRIHDFNIVVNILLEYKAIILYALTFNMLGKRFQSCLVLCISVADLYDLCKFFFRKSVF